MGNFYSNFTLRGPTQEAVAAVLSGRSAIVTSPKDVCIVVYDEEADEQDLDVVAALGAKLSRELQCALLAVVNHDDDVLWYQLYDCGRLVDAYNSAPDYFESNETDDAGPTGGDAAKLCAAFGSSNVAGVDAVLRKPTGTDDGYDFAVDRHADLAAALRIPRRGVGFGYRHLVAGELPEGLGREEMLSVGEE